MCLISPLLQLPLLQRSTKIKSQTFIIVVGSGRQYQIKTIKAVYSSKNFHQFLW